MTDNLKESLSAWIDGEASEIEVHRLLRQFESDASLRPSWVRYQEVRSVIRGERRLDADIHLALQDRIRAAVDVEDTFDERPATLSRPGNRYIKPAVSLAAAASLVAAVLVGVNLTNRSPEPEGVAASNPAITAPAANVIGTGPIDAQPVSTGAARVASMDQESFEPDGQQLELRELSDEQQRQLRAYLNQHDRMVRMNPNLRTVIYEAPANQ